MTLHLARLTLSPHVRLAFLRQVAVSAPLTLSLFLTRTGSSSDFGPVHTGLISRMLDAGSTVVAPSRKLDDLEMLQETLGYPAGLVTYNASPSTTDGAAEVVQMVKQELGRLDGVVAHGGLIHSHPDHPWESEKGSILDSSPEEVCMCFHCLALRSLCLSRLSLAVL